MPEMPAVPALVVDGHRYGIKGTLRHDWTTAHGAATVEAYVYTCPVCSAVVADPDAHHAWHVDPDGLAADHA